MNTTERELIVCLPCYRTYEGRYETFSLAAQYGYRVRLVLLHGPHPPATAYPLVEQVTLPDHLNLWSRRKFWQQWFASLPWDRPTILQDTFLAQMGFYWPPPRLLRHRQLPEIRKVLYLVSPTPGFLFQGHWRQPRSIPMRWQEILYEWRLQFPLVVMEWLSCRFVDGVIGNTQQIALEASRYYGVPAANSCAIPDEVDPFFTPGQRQRQVLGLRDDEVILLYVGNPLRRKGIDILIKALDLLRAEIPAARLVMVGFADPGESAWYSQLITDRDLRSRITFVGRVDRETLREYYRAADVMLYPTRHEGSPRVVKEALGAGCPVVCSDVPGIRIIDPEGQGVIYCAENQPEAYVQPVLRLLRDTEYRQKRIAAGAEVANSLMPDKIITQLLSFYDDLFSKQLA